MESEEKEKSVRLSKEIEDSECRKKRAGDLKVNWMFRVSE